MSLAHPLIAAPEAVAVAPVPPPDGAAVAKRAARRGPFRPSVWLNARQKRTARLAVHYFRAVDVALVWAATLFWTIMSFGAGIGSLRVADALPFALAAVAALGLLRSVGAYGFERGRSAIRQVGTIVGTVALAAVVGGGLGVLMGSGAAAAAYLGWAILMILILTGSHGLWAVQVGRWRRDGVLTPNVVLVGATRQAEQLIEDALERRDVNVLGVFDDRQGRVPDAVAGVPVLGPASALHTHRTTPYLDRIVVAIDPKAHARVSDLTERLSSLPNDVCLLVDPLGRHERQAALDKLSRAPLAPLAPVDPDRRAFNKRLQDLIAGTAAAILLVPVMALVAIAIRLDSPGPILFRQRRHGFNHEEIVVWKFRSMRHETADATASRQVSAQDDRVTRVGRVIRATSLDELPQILNVLRGEMSLVGPRPHAIGMKTGHVESARLVAEYAHRHRIKPGMTGWAAIKGSRGPLHSAQDVRRRVQLDIDYIERQSFWLDLWILVVTLPVLLGDRAAQR